MTSLHHGGHRGNVFVLQVRTSCPPCPLWWRGCKLLTKHVFDTVEEIALVLRFVARPRLELLLRERFRQLFEQLALLFRELLRRLHLHGREQIAAARLARVGDDLSRATALRARPRDGEEALLEADLSLAAALRALTRRRARRRAGSVTGRAVLLSWDLDRRFCAARRFLERDLEVVPQVGAALRSAAPAAAAKQIPETEDVTKTAEDVFEAGED